MANFEKEDEKTAFEIFVIDNNSSDGSIEYLQPIFPIVSFLRNEENAGFAKANNQALRVCSGDYILFLNPDTIIPEDLFDKIVAVFKNNPGVGAAGVQMINGKGQFLPESKRGFPTTWAAFCKLSGLTAVFPTSRYFANYYLGHLNKETTQEVEALSGACMMVKKEVLNKTGGFDERFFMYAEDIDLSYRIRQAGFKNYYLADTTIIHFKGESTKKDYRYVKLFYKAMVQFVQKHYTGVSGRIYASLLSLAIGVRGLIAAATLPSKKSLLKKGTDVQTAICRGDAESISEIKSLKIPNLFVNDVNTPDNVILCEGNDFSFITLIQTMKMASGANHMVHALNSKSVAGN